MSLGKLQIERITKRLVLQRVGRGVEIRDTVDSTNRLAWERVARAEAGSTPSADGWVIFAEHQTAGRGRLGRRWHSPRGAGVLLSLVLADEAGDLNGDRLALLSAVAAVDAVTAATGLRPEIKWPNDLVLNGRKLGGILIESRRAGPREGNVYVVGLGINCLQHRHHFPPEWRESATSLDLESSRPVDREQVARCLVSELDRWLAEPRVWDAQTLRDAWVRRALPLGGRIRLRQGGEDFSGHVLDVDPAAGLLVQLDTGGRCWFQASSTSVLGPHG